MVEGLKTPWARTHHGTGDFPFQNHGHGERLFHAEVSVIGREGGSWNQENMGNPGVWCLFGEFFLQSKSIFQGNFELATSCISFPWTFSWNIWRISSLVSDLVVYPIARKNKSFNQTTPKPWQFRWKNSGVTRWQLSVLVDGFNIISTDMEILRLLKRKNDHQKRWNRLHPEKLTPEKLCLEVYFPFEMVPFQGKCFVISEGGVT